MRRDAPVAKHQLVIEPHLGDLTRAAGVVVTEFGPVPVTWKKENGTLHFTITIPANTVATLALPAAAGDKVIELDGQKQRGKILGARCLLALKPGEHTGSY